jgi:hypothetical protein
MTYTHIVLTHIEFCEVEGFPRDLISLQEVGCTQHVAEKFSGRSHLAELHGAHKRCSIGPMQYDRYALTP